VNPCREHLEDLALLAGGDVPEATSHDLRRHVAACEGCARMLGALEADQSALAAHAGMLHLDVPPVLAGVMARVAADACLQPHGSSVRTSTRAAALAPFARAAAVVLVVVGAAVLGLASLHESVGPAADGHSAQALQVLGSVTTTRELPAAGTPEAVLAHSSLATPASAAPASVPSQESEKGLPVFVRRSGGGGVILTWAGDGRESQAPPGRPSTYKVLASGTPAGFDDARPVEVAGSTLVASMGLPAARVNDRSITFFRVE
jgi:hypothetical protein